MPFTCIGIINNLMIYGISNYIKKNTHTHTQDLEDCVCRRGNSGDSWCEGMFKASQGRSKSSPW